MDTKESNATEIKCKCGKTLFHKEGNTLIIKCQGCKSIRRLSIIELKALKDKIEKIKI